MEHARRIEIMSEIIFDEKRKVFHLRNRRVKYLSACLFWGENFKLFRWTQVSPI